MSVCPKNAILVFLVCWRCPLEHMFNQCLRTTNRFFAWQHGGNMGIDALQKMALTKFLPHYPFITQKKIDDVILNTTLFTLSACLGWDTFCMALGQCVIIIHCMKGNDQLNFHMILFLKLSEFSTIFWPRISWNRIELLFFLFAVIIHYIPCTDYWNKRITYINILVVRDLWYPTFPIK